MRIGRSVYWLLAWGMLWLAGLAATPAAAMAYTPDLCIARAQPGMDAHALFRAPQRFDCTASQRSFGGGDFWLLSRPLPASAAGADELLMSSGWFDRVTLHILYADGAIRSTGFTPGTTGPILHLGAMIGLALPRRASPPVRLLWHVEGTTNLRGVVNGPLLVDSAESIRRDVVFAGLYGGFAGMAIAILVGNLALWAALRQTFQPAFSLLLLCLTCYAATSSGALGEWLPQFDNNDRLRLNALFLAASGVSVVFFARSFFERAVFAGWLGRASMAVSIGVAATGIGFALLAPWHAQLLDRLFSTSFLLLLLLVPAILWRAWRTRSRYLWLFAITWAAPIVLASARVANAMGLIGWSFWIDNSTLISMAFEALLSSLAIAYRIYLLSRERDLAREGESMALQLAEVDPLTGLLNRRAFLTRAIGREGDQILMLADIDHFKRVNDTIGHDGGDEVLRVFSRALRAAVPVEALVSRFGGEEFAIVVDADVEVVPADILDRLRAERMPFDLRVTASIGTCIGPLARESDWKALYRCADRALFEAKASGRDRTRAALMASAA